MYKSEQFDYTLL